MNGGRGAPVRTTDPTGKEDPTMASKTKKKVVLAGCGGIAGAWLRPATRRDDMEFVGFMDINEDAARAKAKEFGLDVATGTDLKKLIKATGADVVFDCTIPEAHCEVVTTALKAGCDVLGEKPMAESMASARKMVRTAEKTGKTYAVIQNRRYAPDIRSVKKFLASGKLGEITTVQSDFFIGAHFGGFRAAMRHVLLLDMAIHTFDAARYVSGADAQEVYAEDWNPKGSWYTHGASAAAVFTMTDDIRYVYHGSWCSEGCNTTWECTWRVVGTKGSLVWKSMDEDGVHAETVKKGEGLIWDPVPVEVPRVKWDESQAGHGGLIDEFLDSIRKGKKPLTDCTDNIKSLAMVHSAIESAEKGKKVKVKA